MEKIGNKLVYTVKEMLETLVEYNPNQLVFASGIDSSGKFFISPIYKIEENADATEIYLCVGQNVLTKERGV